MFNLTRLHCVLSLENSRLVYTPIHVLLACFAFPLNKDGPVITREMAELREWLHFPVAPSAGLSLPFPVSSRTTTLETLPACLTIFFSMFFFCPAEPSYTRTNRSKGNNNLLTVLAEAGHCHTIARQPGHSQHDSMLKLKPRDVANRKTVYLPQYVHIIFSCIIYYYMKICIKISETISDWY